MGVLREGNRGPPSTGANVTNSRRHRSHVLPCVGASDGCGEVAKHQGERDRAAAHRKFPGTAATDLRAFPRKIGKRVRVYRAPRPATAAEAARATLRGGISIPT
jgi:hypothetical protein